LKSYDADHQLRIALPLGRRGDLRDWEIVNRPAKGWRPGKWRAGMPRISALLQRTNTFFAL